MTKNTSIRHSPSAIRHQVAMVLAAVLMCGTAAAQQYPSRPIRMIVPQAPGSASDTVARLLAAELTTQMKQQVVVDNRPGGALQLGLELTSRAAPDGYTIGYCMIGAMAISPNMLSRPPVNIEKDLLPISQTTTGQMLLAASPGAQMNSVKDVIAQAKQNPGKLFNASSGNGTPGHVGFELFKFMTGTQIVHVPYKGGAAGINDLIAGQVQLMMESTNSITPFAKAGRVRALAVTSAKRTSALPEVPTLAESGVPGYEATTWTGIVAPVGLPKPLVARLHAEMVKAVASPSFKEKALAIGSEPISSTPEEFGKFIRSEYAKWGEVIRRSGARID